MKIRAGFVSNSSSSSFVIMCKSSLLDLMPEDIKNYIIENFVQENVLGIDCYTLAATIYDGDISESHYDTEEWLKTNATRDEYYLDSFDS